MSCQSVVIEAPVVECKTIKSVTLVGKSVDFVGTSVKILWNSNNAPDVRTVKKGHILTSQIKGQGVVALWMEHSVLKIGSMGSNPSHGEVFFSVGYFLLLPSSSSSFSLPWT